MIELNRGLPPSGGILTDHNLGISVLVPPSGTVPFGAQDIDAQAVVPLAMSGLRASETAIEVGNGRPEHDAGTNLYYAAWAAARTGVPTPVSLGGERVAAVVPWADVSNAYSLWPEPGARGPALAPPEPTAASITAVLEEAGINPLAVGADALVRTVVAAALKRGYVRGHEDTLAELSGDDEPDPDYPGRADRGMPAVIEQADRDNPAYPWRLAWAGGTRWRDFQDEGRAAVDYYAMTERPCAVYERQEPDGAWYRTRLHKRAPR